MSTPFNKSKKSNIFITTFTLSSTASLIILTAMYSIFVGDGNLGDGLIAMAFNMLYLSAVFLLISEVVIDAKVSGRISKWGEITIRVLENLILIIILCVFFVAGSGLMENGETSSRYIFFCSLPMVIQFLVFIARIVVASIQKGEDKC